MKRQYNCKRCGVPKKGHICPKKGGVGPILLSDGESRPGSPGAAPAGVEEDDSVEYAAIAPQLTLKKRKRIVMDDDSSDEEDPSELLHKAARLVRSQKDRVESSLQKKDEEIAALKKALTKNKFEEEAAELADKFAAKCSELDEMKQEKGAMQMDSVQKQAYLWEIHDSVIEKIQCSYKKERERLEALAPPVAAAPKELWVVTLDNGVQLALPEVAQDVIEKAMSEIWSVNIQTHIDDAYSQTLNGTKHTYKLICRSDATGLHPVQVNQETKKERVLEKKSVVPVAAKSEDLCMSMNEFVVPLMDSDSKFIFESEYEKMLKLNCDNELYTTTSEMLQKMANDFLSSFISKRCVDATGWCRPSLLFHFLSTAKNAFEKEIDPSCFFWAHGTSNDVSISNDHFGMNMRYSSSSNAKGLGVYVACNPYVPMEWARRNTKGRIVFGVATTHKNDQFLERYRMDAGVMIAAEPSNWRSHDVKHAIVLKNSQLNAAIPLGVTPIPF
jgi:hypothetical protein